jgi:hypothetical protein
MKKTFNLNIRIADEDWQKFREACEKLGIKSSAVVRDLAKAALPYMQTECRDGRWRPPVFITERQAALMEASAGIVLSGQHSVKK